MAVVGSFIAPSGMAGAGLAPSAPIRGESWRIALHGEDGALVGMVPADSASIGEQAGRPSTLDVGIPAQHWIADEVAEGCLLRVYDAKDVLRWTFVVIQVDRSLQALERLTVKAEDAVILLNDDIVQLSGLGLAGLEAHLEAVLAAQTSATVRVTLGGIDENMSTELHTFDLPWMSLGAALNEIRKVVGGRYWVDPMLRLWWAPDYATGRTPRHIRWGKNLLGLSLSVDYDETITHLRYFGKTDDGEEIALPEPGYLVSGNYTDQRQRWQVVYDRDQNTEAKVLAAATAHLAMRQEPTVSAQVSILDLSVLPDYSYDDWYQVSVGDEVVVDHPRLSAPVTMQVVARNTQDLRDPANVTITLGRVKPDLSSIVADILTGNRALVQRFYEGYPLASQLDALYPGMYNPFPTGLGPADPGDGFAAAAWDHEHALEEDAVAKCVQNVLERTSPDTPKDDLVVALNAVITHPTHDTLSEGQATEVAGMITTATGGLTSGQEADVQTLIDASVEPNVWEDETA